MISEKNILYVLKSSQPGGVEFHVLDLIKGFARANKVYVMVPEGPLVQEYENAGATVLNIIPSSSFDTKYIKQVKEFCIENRIHIIHTHELICSQAIIGAFLAKVKKRVHHVHTPFLLWKYDSFLQKSFNVVPNFFYNFFLSNFIATDVIALTSSIKFHRAFFELVNPKKIVVVPNSVDVERFKIPISQASLTKYQKHRNLPNNKTIFGVISRITAEKGYFVLVEAFNKLNKKFPNKYFLLIAGGGDLEKEIRKYCEKNFPQSYHITGRFPEMEKTHLLQSMDYFVFPSFAEGFGYVPLEAMSSGLPTIASNLPVLRDVLEKVPLFFTPGNSEDLFVKMQHLVNLKESDKKELASMGIKQAEKYTFDSFIKNYSTVYSS